MKRGLPPQVSRVVKNAMKIELLSQNTWSDFLKQSNKGNRLGQERELSREKSVFGDNIKEKY